MRSRESDATVLNRFKGAAAITGILALMVLGGACSGTDEITAKELTGTWRAIEPGSYVNFHADGTYRIALTIDDLENAPVEEGQFTVEGTLLTFISGEESRNCGAGQRGVYDMEWTGADEMRHRRLEDECIIRSNEPEFINIERVP